MMNAVAEPSLIASFLDRARTALSGHPPRSIPSGQFAKDLLLLFVQRKPVVRWKRAGREGRLRQIFDDEIMLCRIGRKAGSFPAHRAEWGLLIDCSEQYLEFAVNSPWVGAISISRLRRWPRTRRTGFRGWPPYPALPLGRYSAVARALPYHSRLGMFPAVLWEIAGSGYAGWATVELYPYIDNPDEAGPAKAVYRTNAGGEKWHSLTNPKSLLRRGLPETAAAAQCIHGRCRRGDGLLQAPWAFSDDPQPSLLPIGLWMIACSPCHPPCSTGRTALNDVFDIELDRRSSPIGRCLQAASRWALPLAGAGNC